MTLTWPPDFPDPNPIKHLWDVLERVRPKEAPPPNLQDSKVPLQKCRCQTPQEPPPQEVLWPTPNSSLYALAQCTMLAAFLHNKTISRIHPFYFACVLMLAGLCSVSHAFSMSRNSLKLTSEIYFSYYFYMQCTNDAAEIKVKLDWHVWRALLLELWLVIYLA